jgi:O-methyltransferase
MKALAKSLARRLGYEVHRTRTGTSVDELAARSVRDAEYYTRWSPPAPLFTPWSGHPTFERLYEGVDRHSIVPRDRCYILASFADYASHLPGDLAECGVYRGGTALLLCRVTAGRRKRLYLFDSFEGLPALDPHKDEWFEEGQFTIETVDSVRHLLRDFGDVTDIRAGWIPETFSGLEDRTYAFAHVDVDLYQSALDCCRYFYPRLVPGGAIVFDEYGFAATRGERDAVDEFFADKLESPIVLPTGQAVILKLPEPV